MPDTADSPRTTFSMTADIVAAYVSRNKTSATDLVRLIEQVCGALNRVGSGQPAPPIAQAPAVPIKKSITRHYIICLEDGRKLKTMKGHLRRAFGLTPEQYREKWRLPADYPMVAPSYSERRSLLAKELGLGKSKRHARRKGPNSRRTSKVDART